MPQVRELEVFKVKRVYTKEQLKEINGTVVADVEPKITKEGIYVDEETNVPFLVYMELDRDIVSDLRNAVRNIRYSSSGVTRQNSGIENHSRTFGMAPRKPFQTREACRPTALSYEQPEEHGVLVSVADKLADIMRAVAPDVYDKDVNTTSEVADEWRISENSLWTSGVVNKTSTLPYHYDGNNFDMWSAMPIVRRGTRGGYLHIMDYDAAVDCKDGWVAFFPGYSLLHGVTPIAHVQKDAYRYTVVYYCLRGMKDCFTYAVEQAEARKRRTEREAGLVRAIKGEEDFKVGKKK